MSSRTSASEELSTYIGTDGIYPQLDDNDETIFNLTMDDIYRRGLTRSRFKVQLPEIFLLSSPNLLKYLCRVYLLSTALGTMRSIF